MTNNQVIDAFLARHPGQSGSLRTDGQTIWTYATPLAEHDGHAILLNIEGYSHTSSCHRTALLKAMTYAGYHDYDLSVPAPESWRRTGRYDGRLSPALYVKED